MRRSSYAALSALCFALVSGLWLAAAAADTPDEQAETKQSTTPPRYPVSEALIHVDRNPESPLDGEDLLGLKEPAKVELDFPLHSSRRTWGWNRFAQQSSTEPALFFAEDPQPLFRLPDENEIIATPDFKEMPSAFPSTDGTPRYVPQPVDSFGNIIRGNIVISGSVIEEGPVGKSHFTVDNWGIHPATPVPTPVPESDVLIDYRVVPAAAQETKEDASTETPGTELKQGEAAKVILELMDTLGRSVLDGTVFEKPTEVDAQWLKDLDANDATPREALIQYIRALEAQEEAHKEHGREQAEVVDAASEPAVEEEEEIISVSAEEIEIGCPDHRTVEVVYSEVEEDVDEVDDQQAEIESLREASEELEQLANRLERKDNYFRADQVRELAAQLRFDARRAQSPEMAEMMAPGAGMPFNGPFSMGNGMTPQAFPFMPPATGFPPLPGYGPMMPPGASPAMAPPSMSPTPQPTFDTSPNVKQLEAELHLLREELRKVRQPRGGRGELPLR